MHPFFGLASGWWDVGAEFSPDLPLCFAPGCVSGLLVLLTPCQQHPSPTPFPLILFWDSFLNIALQGLPMYQRRHKGETNVLLPDHQNNHKYVHTYIHSTCKHKHTKTHTHTQTHAHTHTDTTKNTCAHIHTEFIVFQETFQTLNFLPLALLLLLDQCWLGLPARVSCSELPDSV